MFVISSSEFGYSKKDNSFSAFLSDLDAHVGLSQRGQTFCTSLDYEDGEYYFYIKSERTGTLERFDWSANIKDNDGDLRYILFRNRKLGIILRVWNT